LWGALQTHCDGTNDFLHGGGAIFGRHTGYETYASRPSHFSYRCSHLFESINHLCINYIVQREYMRGGLRVIPYPRCRSLHLQRPSSSTAHVRKIQLLMRVCTQECGEGGVVRESEVARREGGKKGNESLVETCGMTSMRYTSIVRRFLRERAWGNVMRSRRRLSVHCVTGGLHAHGVNVVDSWVWGKENLLKRAGGRTWAIRTAPGVWLSCDPSSSSLQILLSISLLTMTSL
jgi:hypothetical protein